MSNINKKLSNWLLWKVNNHHSSCLMSLWDISHLIILWCLVRKDLYVLNLCSRSSSHLSLHLMLRLRLLFQWCFCFSSLLDAFWFILSLVFWFCHWFWILIFNLHHLTFSCFKARRSSHRLYETFLLTFWSVVMSLILIFHE